MTQTFRSPQKIVQNIASLLDSSEFIETYRSRPQDFTRQPVLSFRILCLLLLNQLKSALQTELDGFFAALNGSGLEQRVITAQAFSKARNKIRPEAFEALNTMLQAQLNDSGTMKTWQGLRLLAVDGSSCHLPLEAAQAQWFGTHSDQPVARLSSLYDVLNHQVIHAEMTTDAICERGLAQSHLPHAPENSLIVFDRGYPAHWLFLAVAQHQQDFVMRLKLGFNADVRAFVATGDSETTIQLQARTARQRTACEQAGVSPHDRVDLRLIRVELPGGMTEVLATSLHDADRYPTELFKDLYHLRWGVETDFRRLKQTHVLESFSGRTPLAVRQDFHAQTLLKNLACLLATVAQPRVDQLTAKSRHRWQANYTRAVSRLKHTLVTLIVTPSQQLLSNLVELIAGCRVPIRPDRHAPRRRKRPGTRGCEGYKRTR